MNNTPTVSIRKAVPNDIDVVMDIEKYSFHPEIVESADVFADRISVFADGFLVAEMDGKVVGYISSELWDYSDKIPYDNFGINHSIRDTHKSAGNEIYISSVAVDPNVRGGKVGKKLFLTLLESLTSEYDVVSSILIVNSDWKNAHGMYQKEGFTEIGQISGFFPKISSDPLSGTAVIMRKTMK
ncbi:hypothetical protein MsAg5_03460 [Methanosarcinaceae archaeon Ag5]|uniref:N-acetyltransferase domain-containing protein n=1 Tax=Methanolapillus africanus TaxID=3028297 RepID=A0AAE4MI87_9EURY|nr:hypothetical protein [Methanosarcinaceae archaeon Ag5]